MVEGVTLERRDSDDVLREEQGRFPHRGAPIDLVARAERRKRERDQADDERLLLRAIKRRDKKAVLDAMRTLGFSAERLARVEATVEELWKKLPPR